MNPSTVVPSPGETGTLCTALLYRRVSGEEQARAGLSLEAQKARTTRYAARHGWVIGGQFEDVLSGTRDDRPGYQALLAETRRLRAEDRPVAVVVSWLDRFGRSVFERARCAEELRGLGVMVHSVMERGEVPELVANILAAVAEEEVRRLGERQAVVRRYVESKGWQFPTRPAWGYMRRPATREERSQGAPRTVLVVDPERAPYVQEAWNRVAQGASLYATANWIQALPDHVRRGRSYSNATIRRLFTAPVYVARLPTGDPDVLKRPVMRWEPLVDEPTWTRVQDHIAACGQLARRTPTRYLLTSLLRCPNCGGHMSGQHQPNELSSYHCTERLRGAFAASRDCSACALQKPVDALVLAEAASVVHALEMPPQADASARERWRRLSTSSDPKTLEWRRRDLEAGAERVRRAWTEVALLLVDGAIQTADYERQRDVLRDELLVIDAELEQLRDRATQGAVPDLDEARNQAIGWSQTLRGTDLLAKQGVLAKLMERVVPHRVWPRRYRVDITWTALGAALLRWRQQAGLLPMSTDPDVVFRYSMGESGKTVVTAGRRRVRRDTEALRLLPLSAFDVLSERDRKIMTLYHGLLGEAWHSQDEIRERFGLTRSEVIRALREGLIQLLGPGAVVIRHRDEPRRNGRKHEALLRALPSETYATLDEPDRRIIRLYYGLDGRRYRQQEITAQLGVTRWRVQQSLRRSLVQLLSPAVISEIRTAGDQAR